MSQVLGPQSELRRRLLDDLRRRRNQESAAESPTERVRQSMLLRGLNPDVPGADEPPELLLRLVARCRRADKT